MTSTLEEYTNEIPVYIPAAQSTSALLTPEQERVARQSLQRFSRRITPEVDLLAELNERANDLARYQADLVADDFTDCDAEQLRGGIAYEEHHIEAIVAELERRQLARAYGYAPSEVTADADLAGRFERAKRIDLADLIQSETGQSGTRAGGRTLFRCPFHGAGQERSPSLTVYPDGHGHCFGCGWHGDAVDFLAAVRVIGKVEALRLLEAGVIGVRVPA